MKLVLVNNQFQLGGAETVVHQLRGAFSDSRLLVADGKTFPRHVEPLYPRVLSRLYHSRLHCIVEKFFPRAKWTDAKFRALAGSDAEVIHVHNFHGRYATIESLAFLASRKKVVWTFHALWGVTGGCDHPGSCRRYLENCGACPQVGRWPVGEIDGTAAQLQKKIAHLANAPLHIVAPSRFVAEIVRASRIGRNWRVHPIPNGIDISAFDPSRKHEPSLRAAFGIGEKEIVILVVNRDFQDAQKGFSMVREALAAMPAKNVRVLLVGQNSAWAAGQMPPAFGAKSFGYIAERPQLAQIYEIADVFLFASPAETFPCVILEAMAAGCCVVATPSGGVVEQIEHGRCGLLAEKISGRHLGLALRDALAGEEWRKTLGRAARERAATEFSETRMIDSHRKLYREVLDEN